MFWRTRLIRVFLCISVIAWGILVGAKLFDLRVLAGAWSAAPPESLSLLPYGPRYPVDTGDFFIPISAALLIASFGALVCGWQTPRRFKLLLFGSAAAILGTLAFTVGWFWPANRALWHVAVGAQDAIRDRAKIIGLARRWVTYDWLRVSIGTLGLLCSVRAISVPLPPSDPNARRATNAMRLLYAVGILAVLAFVAWFLAKGLG
jgi:hypothetical protein